MNWTNVRGPDGRPVPEEDWRGQFATEVEAWSCLHSIAMSEAARTAAGLRRAQEASYAPFGAEFLASARAVHAAAARRARG